jgi:hypothetical protein
VLGDGVKVAANQIFDHRLIRKHPRSAFSAAIAFAALLGVGLVLIMNGCGGSSSHTSITVPPTYTTPTFVMGSVTPCSADFFSGTTTPAVCQTATIAGCPNTSGLNFTFSYDAPASPRGTIVFLSGGSGTVDLGDVSAASYYFSQGFEVIQVEWSYDWELTNAPTQFSGSSTSTSYPSNIEAAACRNATLLNYIFTGGNTALYSSGGRCAQGSSAGSAAIAYALTFYGAGNYLDAVELKSGPPLADLEQGCEIPNTIQTTICGQNGGNQFGCQLGASSPWTLSPEYTGAASGVRNWTGDSSCASSSTTTSTSNQAWLQQSIVNDGSNSPVYSYPNTAMSGWLCQSVDQSTAPCTGGWSQDNGQNGTPQDSCPNNSSSQAEIYYAKLTSDPNNLPKAAYNIYAVQNCDGPEGVDSPNSTVPALGTDGRDAIEQDMVQRCLKP